MTFSPDPLTFVNGAPVRDAKDWDLRRKEIIGILERELFGAMPPVISSGKGEVVSVEESCCAGSAVLEDIRITVETEKGDFSFPIRFFRPTDGKKHPLFLLINFRPEIFNKYYPAEEIIDGGFALAHLCYTDVTGDDGDFTDGLAACFTRPSDGTGYGKISLWAWAASRALDYLITRNEVDAENVAVIGHSRLGKTALWCGAQDTRFKYVISNDSGCAGAAYERVKHEGSETTDAITRKFPFWFCENYRKYADKAEAMPFDQHMLIAACAPRFVSVGSGSDDKWADPYGEQLGCMGASPVWKMLGKEGLIAPERPVRPGEAFLAGDIGYHVRSGIHFLSRRDWNRYMEFIRLHMN